MSVVAIVDPIKGLIGLDKHKIDNFVFRLDLTFPSDEAVAQKGPLSLLLDQSYGLYSPTRLYFSLCCCPGVLRTSPKNVESSDNYTTNQTLGD